MTETSLLPDSLRSQLPVMGSDPDTPLQDTVVHARLSDPAIGWDWYLLEFDGDQTFFGLVVNRVSAVAGQFTLKELEGIGGSESDPAGSSIALDEAFHPCTVGELAASVPQVMEVLEAESPRAARSAGELVPLDGLD